MTQITNQRLAENEESIKLNNEKVTAAELNEALTNLKPNERIVETNDHNFFVVERLFG